MKHRDKVESVMVMSCLKDTEAQQPSGTDEWPPTHDFFFFSQHASCFCVRLDIHSVCEKDGDSQDDQFS